MPPKRKPTETEVSPRQKQIHLSPASTLVHLRSVDPEACSDKVASSAPQTASSTQTTSSTQTASSTQTTPNTQTTPPTQYEYKQPPDSVTAVIVASGSLGKVINISRSVMAQSSGGSTAKWRQIGCSVVICANTIGDAYLWLSTFHPGYSYHGEIQPITMENAPIVMPLHAKWKITEKLEEFQTLLSQQPRITRPVLKLVMMDESFASCTSYVRKIFFSGGVSFNDYDLIPRTWIRDNAVILSKSFLSMHQKYIKMQERAEMLQSELDQKYTKLQERADMLQSELDEFRKTTQ